MLQSVYDLIGCEMGSVMVKLIFQKPVDFGLWQRDQPPEYIPASTK
jgi:hypothetical protein